VSRYVVIDTETTGLGKSDRIVEIAAVVYDSDRDEIVDEYDTLVNPMRDIGPTDIHGLTPTMVSAAPTFDEVAAAFALKIEDSILVAHNLRFDVRMLQMEYERLDAKLNPGSGVCTLRLTGSNLSSACTNLGIPLTNHHRALADARVATEILRRLLEEDPGALAASVNGLTTPLNTRTLRRDARGDSSDLLPLSKMVRGVRFPTTDEALLSYMDALDWVLDDLVIDASEKEQLESLAESLGIDSETIGRAHRGYFKSLVLGAQRDGIVTSEEHELLETVATLLSLGDVEIPKMNDVRQAPSELEQGWQVCFTGTAVIDGVAVPREEIEETAAFAGLQPIQGVTKKCNLLVCADPASMSGKAKKARDYGIPIMSFQEFVSALGYVELS
jgi:DNA polymerase-3 subunit epsilon